MEKRVYAVLIIMFMMSFFSMVSAENLNLKIIGAINNYSSDIYLKSSAFSNNGNDAYDMETSPAPETFASFYSSAGGSSFSIDSWNGTERTLNLTFSLPVSQTGTVSFSWDALTGNYTANLTYFGTDSSYTTPVAVTDMRTSSSYSTTLSSASTAYLQVSVTNYTAIVCGDGSCGNGETCSSCPGDCGVCRSITTSLEGGGGGGGAPAKPEKGIEVDTQEINMNLIINTNKERTIKITNNGKTEKHVSIEQRNMDSMVLIKEPSFSLAPGESKEVSIIFVAPGKAGVYTGKLIVAGNTVLISLNVRTKELLFDAMIVVPEDEKMIAIGDNLDAQITLIPMGEEPRVDVTLNYVVKDYEGKTYLTESETILVEGQKTFKKEFSTRNLPMGSYVVGLEVVYPGGVAASSSHFNIEEETKNNLVIIIVVAVVGITVLAVFGFSLVRSFRKNKKKFARGKF